MCQSFLNAHHLQLIIEKQAYPTSIPSIFKQIPGLSDKLVADLTTSLQITSFSQFGNTLLHYHPSLMSPR